MESHYPHTTATNDPHANAVIGDEGEGEPNHPGEKKSVMKKVKDKAKKIKDTIKKHGGHGHDHDEEEEDDDDEETVNASEVHGGGAPLQETGFISGTNLPKQTGLDLEKPAGPSEDLNPTAKVYPPNVEDDRGAIKTYGGTGHDLRNEEFGSDGTEVTDNPGVWEMYDSKDKTTKIPDLQHDPQAQNRFPTSTNAVDLDDPSAVADPTVKIGPLEDLEKDPHSPNNRPEDIHPSNYQTKVVDPTGKGGKEADVSPLVQRLGNLQVSDESESEKQRPFTGSHNQFAPQSTPTIDEFNPESESPKTLDPARPESMPRDTIAGKISSATSAIADKAVSAKKAVASKLGYGEAGVAAVDGGGGGGGGVESDKGVSVSVREYLSEKLSPGEEDRALSEAITDAISRRKGYGPEDSGPESSENTGSGPGVVGRVKGAVSSWLGMSGGAQNVEAEPEGEGDDVHAGEGATTTTQGIGGGLH